MMFYEVILLIFAIAVAVFLVVYAIWYFVFKNKTTNYEVQMNCDVDEIKEALLYLLREILAEIREKNDQ